MILQTLPGADDVAQIRHLLDPKDPSDGTVNCWLIGRGQQRLLVDTGQPLLHTLRAWQEIFAGKGSNIRLNAILCTHGHPDHAGLSDALAQMMACPLYMTRPEVALRAYYRDAEARYLARKAMLGLAGFADGFDPVRPNPPEINAPAVPIQILRDGDRIELGGRSWDVITGGGHSPEAICLLDATAALLLCGDQLLPDIAPYIGVPADQPDADPLGDYFRFLARMEQIGPATLALPGHGEPFRDIPGRAGALRAKHQRRLDRILATLVRPATCAEIMPGMFAGRWSQSSLVLFVSVALAHLNYLVRQGQIVATVDSNGQWIFSPSGMT